MSLNLFKCIAALSIFCISLIAGWLPIRARTKENAEVDFRFGEAVTSGVFLGAALFHMLPDAQAGLQESLGNFDYPAALLICALGFISLLFFEKVLFSKKPFKQLSQMNLVPYTLTLVLSIHALIAGAAVGINTTLGATLIIFIAVMAHKGFESFALVIALNRSTLTTKQIILIFIAFCCVTPLGIFLGSYLTTLLYTQTGILSEAIFNAIAAGTFLYIATLHNMQFTKKQSINISEFIGLLFGVSAMAIVALWL